jgi:hypothetical protein
MLGDLGLAIKSTDFVILVFTVNIANTRSKELETRFRQCQTHHNVENAVVSISQDLERVWSAANKPVIA